jgi:hypothetical protein
MCPKVPKINVKRLISAFYGGAIGCDSVIVVVGFGID